MTSAASEPAWYRLLPKPSTDHHPALRRPSSLSQHHLFHDRTQDHASSGEDGFRRNTVHVPISENSKSTTASREYIGESQGPANATSRSASPSGQRHSSEMAEIQSHPAVMRPNSNPRENVCLCPASPKIPRPRNSFILFRQHQQSSIIAQNPGIPNPEVSKIIGEQWRGLSAEAKEEWNLLAEEEKARHQQQYPGYRYHPRRNGRVSNQSSVSGPSSAEPQEPCAKCGGKPMNYYSNPTPVYTPPVSVTQQTMAVTVPAKRGYVVSAAPPGQRISPDHAGFQRIDPRLVYAVPPPGQTIPTPPSAESQDAKRRRLGNGVYVPARDVYPEATYSYAHSPTTNGQYVRQEIVHHPSQIQHIQVPKPQMVSPPRAYPRPPALQPIRPPLPHQRNRSSVALPSIETMVSQTPTKSSAGQLQGSGVEAMVMSIPVLNKIKVLSQLSSPLPAPGVASPKPEVRGAIIAVEGMDATSVNSMTNSLAEQLEKEGKFAVRVIGGPDPYTLLREAKTSTEKKGTDAYLKLMTRWHELNREMVEYITSRPGCGRKSSSSSLDNQDADRQMSGVDEHQQPLPTPVKVVRIDARQQSVSTKDVDADKLDSAISPKTIVADPPSKSSLSSQFGHKGRSLSTPGLWTSNESGLDTRPPPPSYTRPPSSRRIPPPPPTPSPATPPPPPAPVSKPLSRIPPMPASISSTPSNTTIIPPPFPPKASPVSPSSTAIPIAIVPHFQLTTVDACSITMAIGDNFSPPAHWQWFATMWRGSTGPDITIVIRGVDEEAAEGELPKQAVATLPGIPGAVNATGNAPAARERLPSVASSQSHSGGTGVEIRLHDSRAVIVKTGIATSVGFSTGNVGEEKAGSKAMSPAQQAKEMENWEKAKRRVGFEVEEFLRR